MPVSPYAKLEVRVNGGAWVSGEVNVEVGDTVSFRNQNGAFVTSQRFEITDYPEGFDLPAGWTADADGTYFNTDVAPPDITIGPWGKYMPELTVNGDMTAADRHDATTGLSAPSPGGLRDMAGNEEDQFGGDFLAWVRDHKRNLRVIESQLVISGTVDTTLGGTDTPAALDTSSFGAEAIIEVAATFFAIQTAGGAAKARFKRTRTFIRTADVLDDAQAIEPIGTDYNNLAGGLGSVDIDFSGDSIAFEVTGDGTNALTWWVEYTYSVRALAA